MKGGVVGTHVILKHGIELCKGGNGADIKSVQPAFFQCAEVPLYLALTGAITDFRVEKQHAQGYTDHGKLFIRVTAAIIDVKLIRDAIGGNGGFKDLLEVTGIVVIEQFTANQKPGMVINNHDASGGTVRFSGTPEPGYGETGERNRQNAGQIPWRRKRRNLA